MSESQHNDKTPTPMAEAGDPQARLEAEARRAIVTGADSGIGRATAVALAAAGIDVGITWHSDEAGAQETAEEVRSHGARAVVTRLDVADIPACGDVIDGLIAELGGVDVFVNNAGAGLQTPFLDVTLDEWNRVLDTDLTGAFVCLQRAARAMVAAPAGGSSPSRACTSTSRWWEPAPTTPPSTAWAGS